MVPKKKKVQKNGPKNGPKNSPVHILLYADIIKDTTLNACEELVSYDVVSLFTKIPVDLAVNVAEERLREDASVKFPHSPILL